MVFSNNREVRRQVAKAQQRQRQKQDRKQRSLIGKSQPTYRNGQRDTGRGLTEAKLPDGGKQQARSIFNSSKPDGVVIKGSKSPGGVIVLDAKSAVTVREEKTATSTEPLWVYCASKFWQSSDRLGEKWEQAKSYPKWGNPEVQTRMFPDTQVIWQFANFGKVYCCRNVLTGSGVKIAVSRDRGKTWQETDTSVFNVSGSSPFLLRGAKTPIAFWVIGVGGQLRFRTYALDKQNKWIQTSDNLFAATSSVFTLNVIGCHLSDQHYIYFDYIPLISRYLEIWRSKDGINWTKFEQEIEGWSGLASNWTSYSLFGYRPTMPLYNLAKGVLVDYPDAPGADGSYWGFDGTQSFFTQATEVEEQTVHKAVTYREGIGWAIAGQLPLAPLSGDYSAKVKRWLMIDTTGKLFSSANLLQWTPAKPGKPTAFVGDPGGRLYALKVNVNNVYFV